MNASKLIILALILSACAKKDAPIPLASRQNSHKLHVLSVNIRPHVNQMTAGDTTQLCAFVVMSDSSIQIGVSDTPDSLKVRTYCSGAPLTAFLSERTT